jgi:predicted O-linked N-acetylglucosamine transferase (SPINDLY family)
MAASAKARRERTREILRRAGVGHVIVRTDADYVEPLIAFFRGRARRG